MRTLMFKITNGLAPKYSCGHKYRDTLHDFIFAKVVHNIVFKSHSPTCYVSKSQSRLILIPYLLFFI